MTTRFLDVLAIGQLRQFYKEEREIIDAFLGHEMNYRDVWVCERQGAIILKNYETFVAWQKTDLRTIDRLHFDALSVGGDFLALYYADRHPLLDELFHRLDDNEDETEMEPDGTEN